MCELSLGLPVYSEEELHFIGDRQFENKLKILEEMGILLKQKENKTVLYAISKTMLQDVFEDDKSYLARVQEMLHFLSCSDGVGSVGYLISKRMGTFKPSIQFKHQYITNVLNDYNKIDLLYAIKHNLWVNVTYRDGEMQSQREKSFWCFPVEIRESVIDGLQYLIYYLSEERTISTARLDYINSIEFGTMDFPEYFDCDIDNAHWLLHHTWGSSFKVLNREDVSRRCALTTIRFTIEYDREKESFIERRIMREIRNCPAPKKLERNSNKNRWIFEAKIAHPQEIYQWVQSYISRIVSLEIVGESSSDAFFSEISRNVSQMDALYNTNSIKQKPLKLDCMLPHEMLFNEIFSDGFRIIGNIIINLSQSEILTITDIDNQVSDYKSKFEIGDIKKEIDEKARKDIEAQIEDYRVGQIKNIIDFLFEKMSTGIKPKYIFKGSKTRVRNGIYDILPLTLIEVQWLINILSESSPDDNEFSSFPLSRYFLTDIECKAILAKLDNPCLYGNEINLYDQFIVPRETHQQVVEKKHLLTIIEAIKKSKKLSFKYFSPNSAMVDQDEHEWVCLPYMIEYSRRDNTFRLISRNKLDEKGNLGITRAHNLERFISATIKEEAFDSKILKQHVLDNRVKTTSKLVMIFDENRGIADLIINEFSPWAKQCLRYPSGQYQLTIEYDAFEYKEIGIRLLSYGCDVFVVSDYNSDPKMNELVLKDIKDKINAQKEYSRTITENELVFPKVIG